jgi:hypothetical protein
MPLTLEADSTYVMKWWVDASFAAHTDMRSHTGGMLSLGKGAIYGTSTRQKLNTKSSTEGELVAVNDVMPQVLWTRYFLESQGYQAKEAIVYQDNQSTLLLAKNGRASSSKRTRHINICYFSVTDCIASGEVLVEYCPTKKDDSRFFTKPLQGSLFTESCDMIMNIAPGNQDDPDHRSVLEQVSANDTGGPLTVVREKKFRVRIKSEDRASKILRKDNTNRKSQVTHGLNGTLNPA